MLVIDVFDCFAGYGGAEFALTKAGILHRCIGFSEIDKYAIQCFRQNHGDVPHYGDIKSINWKDTPDFDLLCGGFPCQDISQAGKQDLSKGRSKLIEELIRCLKEKKPKYFLFENVAAIETKPFKEFLRGIENDLKRCGYVVFRKCLNSKDFGVPQNRERVWWVGIRKDLHKKEFGWTPWPKQVPLKLKLKDILESGEVDRDTSYCLDANYWKGTNYRHYKEKGLRQVVFLLPCATKSGLAKAVEGDGIRLQFPKSVTARGRVVKGLAQTVQANSVNGVISNNKIRKLTPKECFRLQGFLNDEIKLDGLSNRQKYKLAGNGWEITVPSLIFKQLFA